MKKRLKSLLFFAIFLLLICNISASITIGNVSNGVSKAYGAGEDIRGWINLSLVSVPLTTEVSDTRGNSVDIIDLLKSDSRLTQGTDYSCNPSDCGIRYVAYNPQTSKTFELQTGESKILGFEFIGSNFKGVSDVEFDIESDAESSCYNQLEITFMLDDPITIANTKSDIGICDFLEDYGCFNRSKTTFNSYRIGKGPVTKHCQRIKLSASPGFRLGAWMNLQSSGDITMAIYDITDLEDELASCEIEENTGSGRYSCDVDYLVLNEDDYYVCIYSDKTGEISEIRGYPTANGCAYFYDGVEEEELYAYDIFAIGKKFASIGKLHIEDEIQNEISLSERFEETIDNVDGYGGQCTNGCVIPMRIKSKTSQEITINNISILSGDEVLRIISEVNTSSATVSTNGSKLIYMDNANFSLPTATGGFPYTLKIDNTNIFNATITIQPVPIINTLSPTTTFSKFPTYFNVFVTNVGNATIRTYTWDFNGEIFTTTKPSASYIFDDVGIFPVEVTIEDTAGRISSKTFNVNVGSYTGAYPSKMNKTKADIARIEAQLANFSQFEQDGIKKVVDPTKLKANITTVETMYGQGQREEAIALWLSLNIPESIVAGVRTSYVPIYPKKENINIDAVGGTYDASKESQYVNAISEWYTTNIDGQVKYSKIVGRYEGDVEEQILNVIELKASKKKTMNYSSTIYVEELDDLDFAASYGEQIDSGYAKIPFDTQEKTITFSTTEEVDFLDIPVFISPALSNLVLIGDVTEEERGMRWALFILLIFFLLLAGFIVYIVLQQWYKTKYETYLFKNRNYLFNLITYIQNSKKKGVSDAEITKKLRKQGWTSEQITYVMKKYIGKRTGMIWEVPIDKVLSWFRKKQAPKTMPLAPISAPTPTRPIIPVQRNFPAQRFPGASGNMQQQGKKEFFKK